MTHSGNKGNRGEREVLALFEGMGYRCNRSKQGAGSDAGPDVHAIGPVVDFCVESKRYKTSWSCVYPGLEQAEAWTTGSRWTVPIVRLRHDRREGLIIMKEREFLKMMEILDKEGCT